MSNEALRIEVNGRQFEVEEGEGNSYHYSAADGPHVGSGFTVGGSSAGPLTKDDHIELISDWLDEIDPETGYLPDDDQ